MELRREYALRPGTIANHRTHLYNYLRFCIYFGVNDFPASGLILSMFTEFLSRSCTAPNSIFNAI